MNGESGERSGKGGNGESKGRDDRGSVGRGYTYVLGLVDGDGLEVSYMMLTRRVV